MSGSTFVHLLQHAVLGQPDCVEKAFTQCSQVRGLEERELNGLP